MKRDQTPSAHESGLLDVHRPGPDGLRVNPEECARAVGSAGPAEAQAAHAASGGNAGGAQGVEAGSRTLTAAYGWSHVKVGDVFTIGGVREPDPRWWPRFVARVLRRPPPTREKLVRFRVSQVTGITVEGNE